MVGWRILASGLGLLLLASAAQAQTVLLQEKNQPGTYFHVAMDLELKGTLLLQPDKAGLEQEVTARHDFVERVLQEGENGLFAKTARFYQSAKSTITLDKKKTEFSLPDEKRFIVAQRIKEGVQSYSPTVSLTREELDVLEHFDTLALPGLLAGKEVAVGAAWKLHDAAAQGLCSFEGLTTNDLSGKLVEVKEKKATFVVTGEASGICAGAVVKLKIQAEGVFDVALGRITSLTWTQQDDREQGPASPKMAAQVTVKLTREAVEQVAQLSDVALVPVPQGDVPASKLALAYADHKKRYQLNHDRAWILVARTDEHLVLRLLDRGDFVAQVSISCWPNAGEGKHVAEEEFKKAMTKIPGWAQGNEKESGTVKAENGYWIYRLVADGLLNGQNTVQYFYLVAGPNGDQAVLAFALTPTQAGKLGTRDLDLVRSLLFTGNAPAGLNTKTK